MVAIGSIGVLIVAVLGAIGRPVLMLLGRIKIRASTAHSDLPRPKRFSLQKPAGPVIGLTVICSGDWACVLKSTNYAVVPVRDVVMTVEPLTSSLNLRDPVTKRESILEPHDSINVTVKLLDKL